MKMPRQKNTVTVYLNEELKLLLDALMEDGGAEAESGSAVFQKALVEYGEKLGYELIPPQPARIVRRQ